MEVSSKDEQRRQHQLDLKNWLKNQGRVVRSSSQWPGQAPEDALSISFLEHFQTASLAPGFCGAFVPLPTEPPVEVFLRQPGPQRWCFPRTAEGGSMEMRHTFFAEENFERSRIGVWEPKVSRSSLVPKNQIKTIVLPGVGFDRKGQRLGRGGGYYDRLLEGFSGRRIAVAFSCQIQNGSLKTEAHDQPVYEIWTETERIVVERVDSRKEQ